MAESVGPDGEPEKDIARTTRHRTALVLLLALVVLGAATLVTKVSSGAWSSTKRSFCWGAWQEGSDPEVLGDAITDGDTFARSGKESAPPAHGERATCSVRLTTTVERDGSDDEPGGSDPGGSDGGLDDGSDVGSGDGSDDGSDEGLDEGDSRSDGESSGSTEETAEYKRVNAEFGPVPRGAAQRRAWLMEFLDARAAPLPEGLPGVVGKDRGMLVLPRECDSGGLPSVVTVRGAGDMPSIGGEQDVADLLLSLANTARAKAGCDAGKPSRVTVPLRGSERDDTFYMGDSTCRVPGLRLAAGREDHYNVTVGAVEKDLQTCSIEDQESVRAPVPAGQFVMTSRPRFTALFTGLSGEAAPGKGWRGKGRIDGGNGLVTAECRGRPTVFFLQLDDRLEKKATPDSRRVFARAVNSVAERVDCPAVAPST
ncbi:hypothetical protein [Streptomyces iconiensis]|uniref:Serine/threonine protein kinase n=1 Tax=Streptomyces iconiensis TaxID=1384038 RepID=A0ABT6ZWF8_9ACTN|nr:hypothetical protein [Streptomyces iconiensis]MDJ1133401.1 hypothetical protein [Streptomyces iconiensis]